MKIHEFDVWEASVVQKLKVLYKKYQQLISSNIQTLENINISHTCIFVKTAETTPFLVLQAPPIHPITVNLMSIRQNFADLSHQVYVRSLTEEFNCLTVIQAFKHVSFISLHTLKYLHLRKVIRLLSLSFLFGQISHLSKFSFV